MIGLLVTSRNNYNFLDGFWLPRIKTNFPILNIDDDSSKHEKKKGMEICKKNNVAYLNREEAGVQGNIVTACNYFKKNGIKMIIWFQHDCYPYDCDKFFNRLNVLVDSGSFDDLGAIGFNALATDVVSNYDKQIKMLEAGENPLGIVARSPLSKDRLWLTGFSSKHSPKLDEKLYKTSFSVPSTAWFASGVMIDQYMKHIDINNNFRFFNAWDDICFQFLNKNIHNIAVRDVYVCHRPEFKSKFGLPASSVKYSKKSKNIEMYGKYTHLDEWQRKWGWKWEDRKTFKKIAKKYDGTLIWEFYNHDHNKGPLKRFDI